MKLKRLSWLTVARPALLTLIALPILIAPTFAQQAAQHGDSKAQHATANQPQLTVTVTPDEISAQDLKRSRQRSFHIVIRKVPATTAIIRYTYTVTTVNSAGKKITLGAVTGKTDTHESQQVTLPGRITKQLKPGHYTVTLSTSTGDSSDDFDVFTTGAYTPITEAAVPSMDVVDQVDPAPGDDSPVPQMSAAQTIHVKGKTLTVTSKAIKAGKPFYVIFKTNKMVSRVDNDNIISFDMIRLQDANGTSVNDNHVSYNDRSITDKKQLHGRLRVLPAEKRHIIPLYGPFYQTVTLKKYKQGSAPTLEAPLPTGKYLITLGYHSDDADAVAAGTYSVLLDITP